MTEQEKMNIAIHEFIDGRFWPYKGNSSYEVSFKTYEECLNAIEKNNWVGYAPEIGWGLKYGKYHSSWDALMPVVEKIESLKTEKDGYFGVHISSNSCTIQGTKFRSELRDEVYYFDIYSTTKLNATWLAIKQFIKWYNDQNQSFITKQPANQE